MVACPKTAISTSAGEARSHTGTARNTSGSWTGPPGSGENHEPTPVLGLRTLTSFPRLFQVPGASVQTLVAHAIRGSLGASAVLGPVLPPVGVRAWSKNRMRTVTVATSGVPPRLMSARAPVLPP
ncbi:hypothetical protein [Fodinicola feengrottensis]|uniref:hypothetical protein n=1 Tax=Fodinicola feengrottensis TaxID=435914 RepID=UPI0031D03D8A